MSSENPLEYLEEEVFPELEDFEFYRKGTFDAEDIAEYEVELEEELLTQGTEELRSYSIEYKDFKFPMSVELGLFEGRRSIGISAEAGNILQDNAIAEAVIEISDAYDTSRTTLGHGDYVLDIEDW